MNVAGFELAPLWKPSKRSDKLSQTLSSSYVEILIRVLLLIYYYFFVLFTFYLMPSWIGYRWLGYYILPIVFKVRHYICTCKGNFMTQSVLGSSKVEWKLYSIYYFIFLAYLVIFSEASRNKIRVYINKYIYIFTFITSLWCRSKARRWVSPLNTQCFQNSAENG